jgi:hypothetical protein
MFQFRHMTSRKLSALMRRLLALLSLLVVPALAAPAPATLKVSENKRFLITGDSKPFFYLGDTAWELFHRLNREEADAYLTQRAAAGFTVIQAVALAEMDGLNTPNAYGHRPLVDNDPAKPEVQEGPANDYWDHVDYIVRKANSLGLVIGFLPTWGDKWNKKWGVGPEIFTADNAWAYGEWLGKRYKNDAIIWITGGDRPLENDAHVILTRAMAEGLRVGDEGKHLITFHPSGGRGSAEKMHGEGWLDFNMRQNGHMIEYGDRYSKTLQDYQLKPIKPVIDGEPVYEDHPVSFAADKNGHTVAADVRRPLYWNLFNGAFGHTYGHHSVWQMFSSKVEPKNFPLMSWEKAILQPGAAQMKHGKNLMLSRPFLTRVPDDTLVVKSDVPTSIPGAGTRVFVGTRDESSSYAMIYAPVGRAFSVDLSRISGSEVTAWWFDPRTGKAQKAGRYTRKGIETFLPPTPGELLDWVLVLDDASKGFLPPGS